MAKNSPRQSRPATGVVSKSNQPQQIQTTTFQQYEGPIPHPDALSRYNEIIPGAAERIMAMAERETEHRHSQESKAIQANIDSQKTQLLIAEQQSRANYRSGIYGQTLGFVISFISICGGIYLAINGQAWFAAALVGLPLAGVIRAIHNKTKPPD